MNNERLRVIAEIIDLFSQRIDPVEIAKRYADEQLERMLDVVFPEIPFRDARHNNALSQFLYAGCLRFDRWIVPTPFVVPPGSGQRFKKFLSALKHAELGHPTNCSTFEIHKIKDDIFAAFDLAPAPVAKDKIVEFERRIQSVLPPKHDSKRKEYESEIVLISEILEGLRRGDIFTELCFRVPYVVHKQALDVGFSWQGICGCMEIQPAFQSPGESFVKVAGGVALSVGADRWQGGSSKVTIQIASLFDGSAFSEPLQAIAGHELPFNGWPKSFTVAFEIFGSVVGTLRQKYGGRQEWLPAPRDLSDLSYKLFTPRTSSIWSLIKGSPASVVEAFTPSRAIFPVELGEVSSLKWSDECRLRATMHLELGDTNEAMFWVNVAVETLISQRFAQIAEKTGRAGLVEELGSPKEYWAESEAILVKQFPEMAGKVKWPSALRHVSVFGKLKVLYRTIEMRTSIDELLSRYREISRERNDLFHGNMAGRIAVSSVLTALDCLAWIESNMWPAEK